MRYDPPPSSFHRENRATLAAALAPNALAVVLSNDIMPRSADGVLGFHQNRDLLYLSGIDQEETILLLCPGASDPADREILFVRETSDFIAIWEGQKFTREEAAALSGIENVQWSDQFERVFRRLMKQVDTVYLNHNEHPGAAKQFETRDDRFRKQTQSLWPDHRYRRLAPLIYRQRMHKAAPEIDLLQRAIDITEAGFRRVLPFIEPGRHEFEIEAEYLHEFLTRRSRGFAYAPIIASGLNNCVLHYLVNDHACADGDLLLMDVGAEYGGYNADMTRTVPVNGKFTPRQRAVYDAVLRVLKAGSFDLLRPGKAIKDYQKEIARLTEIELVGLGLITQAEVDADNADQQKKEEEKAYRKYFMHGVAHPLGLDVHDVGPADIVIEEGAVFTVEPGIYLRDEGFGIRLEDNILVGADENINLMAGIPIAADEIEALMGERG